MASVTIGVPVYNGAATLRECLECLRNQTFRDIEVLISDNASSDNSAAIAQEFVDRDPRFKLICQSENIGARRNFDGLLEMATTDFFMWRSDDDLSDENFVEVLKASIESNSRARLAAPKVVFLREDGSVKSEHGYPDVSGASRATRIGRTLMGMNPSWIYGLWDRRTLIATLERTSTAYPYLWAWDPLALFPVVLDEGVSNAEHTRLFKRVVPARYSSRTTAANMMAMRREFRAACLKEFSQRNWTFPERIVLFVYVLRFANRNVYRRFKLMRRYLREKLGIVK